MMFEGDATLPAAYMAWWSVSFLHMNAPMVACDLESLEERDGKGVSQPRLKTLTCASVAHRKQF